MKKILTFFCFLLYLKSFACSCCYSTTTFCGNIKDNNTKVVLLKVQKFEIRGLYQQVIIANVIDDLFDNVQQDTITVFGSNGANCNDNLVFGINDTILIKLYETTFEEEIIY